MSDKRQTLVSNVRQTQTLRTEYLLNLSGTVIYHIRKVVDDVMIHIFHLLLSVHVKRWLNEANIPPNISSNIVVRNVVPNVGFT